VMSTLDMVRALQINAVGEGIETDAVADILQQLGCQYGQGFLFGRPLALEDLLVRNADDAAVRSAPSGPSA
jgi:EAL domain-containing protein (putative c-di-GMP-specific phosphodiesterase class I)